MPGVPLGIVVSRDSTSARADARLGLTGGRENADENNLASATSGLMRHRDLCIGRSLRDETASVVRHERLPCGERRTSSRLAEAVKDHFAGFARSRVVLKNAGDVFAASAGNNESAGRRIGLHRIELLARKVGA